MFWHIIFLLFPVIISSSGKVAVISLQKTPMNTSLGVNFTLGKPVFLEFRLENNGIELYPTSDCPMGDCKICPYHYVVMLDQEFECEVENPNIQGSDLQIPKNTKVKFLKNSTLQKLRIFDGHFGLVLIKKIMKANKIKKRSFVFNGTHILLGKSLKRPAITLDLNRDVSINSSKFQVGGRFVIESFTKIHFKPDRKGIMLPERLFKKVRTFLHFARVKCKMSRNSSLKCRSSRSFHRLKDAYMEFTLDNNQKMKIKVNSLLRNCGKSYCESLIYLHHTESVYVMGSILSDYSLAVNLGSREISFKKQRAESRSLIFERAIEQTELFSKSSIFQNRNLLKALFVISIIVISVLIGRKVYKCLASKIEKSLPNYSKPANPEESEPVNSFKIISAEIRNARKINNAQSFKPVPQKIQRAKKPIFNQKNP